MTAPSLAELRERYRVLVAPLGACTCGIDRRPLRTVAGCLSLLICARCGGRTTERKEA